MMVVVDEDVNIYSAEDVIWALMTRVAPKEDIISFGLSESGMAVTSERTEGPTLARVGRLGRLGFDATVPFDSKDVYARKRHPKVDLEKWFTKEDIDKVWAQQNEYARFIAENRF